MKLNVTFKEHNDTFKADFGEVVIIGDGKPQNPLEYATDMRYTFMNSQFPAEHELCVNLPVATTLANAFYGAKGVKKIVIEGNKSQKVIAFNQAFRACTDLETIDLSKYCAKISNGSDMCYSASKLCEILGELDFTDMTAITPTTFAACGALEEVRIKKNSLKLSINFAYCPKLSSETIQSIIDGLAAVEAQQTLTINAAVFNILTDEQILQITNKNWVVQ